ncbi:MAG: hypothetical protein MHMPM18_002179 [Marteilia pararefringens]
MLYCFYQDILDSKIEDKEIEGYLKIFEDHRTRISHATLQALFLKYRNDPIGALKMLVTDEEAERTKIICQDLEKRIEELKSEMTCDKWIETSKQKIKPLQQQVENLSKEMEEKIRKSQEELKNCRTTLEELNRN